jgi:hypothetical protein
LIFYLMAETWFVVVATEFVETGPVGLAV